MFRFEEQDIMRRGRSADNKGQCEHLDPHGSQASHAQQPEDLSLPRNPNEVIGTFAGRVIS